MKKNPEAYASQRGRKFKTSMQEQRAFVGTTLLTHLPIKSNQGLNGMLLTPLLFVVFSCNHFAEILRNLHFSAILPAPEHESVETCILNSFILMRRGHGGIWTKKTPPKTKISSVLMTPCASSILMLL